MRYRRQHWLLPMGVAAGAIAFDASAVAEDPWAERAIEAHIDYLSYAWPLDAGALAELVAAGKHLFTAQFTVNDGAGRPLATQAIIPTKRDRPPAEMFVRTSGPDANSCASCHRDPAPGGAGDFTVNVFVSEGFQSVNFDNLDPSFSSERGTNHMFGAGLIELLAGEMTADLWAVRDDAIASARDTGAAVTMALATKSVNYGSLTAYPDGTVDLSAVEGVDADLIIRAFGQKGVFGSIRQFTINAANDHHGMQAEERFGARWTGEADFDGDGHEVELTIGDISALVAFQATLAPPVVDMPDDEAWIAAAASGESLFQEIGCVACHRPSLPLSSLTFTDPSPLDQAGTLRRSEVEAPIEIDLALLEWATSLPRDEAGNVLVPLFGDLKRHRIADFEVAALGNELLSQRFVEPDVFITAELWGVGSTAPYGHRNDLTTLDEIIRAHGGEARSSRDLYVNASDVERSSLIAFLRTLVIVP